MPSSYDVDRRAQPREAVKIPGRLFYGDNLEMWADCELRDLSGLGAKIGISKLFKLPERALLVDLQNGLAYDVLVKWRRRDMAGLQFEVRYELNGVIAPRLQPARDVWRALNNHAT